MRRKGAVLSVIIVGLVAIAAALPWGNSARSSNPNSPWEHRFCSRAGAWIGGNHRELFLWTETVSPDDPTGKSLTSRLTFINAEPTLFGMFQDADAWSDFVGRYVRTGKNTYDYTGHGYVTGTVDGMPNQVLGIMVMTGSGSFADCETWQATGGVAVYVADQDADGDGHPDAGQEPLACIPFATEAQRVQILPGCAP